MTYTSYNNTKSMLIVGSIVTLSMIAMVNPAAAYGEHYKKSSSDISVTSTNSASVLNAVVVGANTGYNTVAGGNTGAGGDGGDATGKKANGGHGGTSGSSNNEAVIGTGNATAIGTVNNDINSNRTKITTDCECENRKSKGDITVASHNDAEVGNLLGVDANTGDNAVLGGTTGAGGNGGNAESYSWSKWKSHHSESAANGGHGGNTGGTNNVALVLTGESVADGLVVNVVNRNVTRVAR